MQVAMNDEKKIGLSADYDRNIFTLDPKIVDTVLSTFVDMYKAGMIYKGVRIVNWDPKARTAVADNQMVREERDGKLYYVQYKFADDSSKSITVATTRPETMFGDTAIAVNPSDPRYKDLVGKEVVIPLTDIKIPIITNYKVLTDFGTGALKITPAHSQDDYQTMMEWNKENPAKAIEARNIIDNNLMLVSNFVPQQYRGQKYTKVKDLIIEDLKIQSFLIKEEIVKQNISKSERTGALIEPIMASQWYLKYDKPDNNIKQAAIDMVKNGQVTIHPQNMVDKYNHWMDNLRDWAISRSLWWGYRLPVWYHGEVKEEIDENGEVKELISSGGSENWVPLEYGNPEHLRVQQEDPQGTIIDVVRHGETIANVEKRFAGHLDVELTDTGKDQANDFKTEVNYDLIISSDLKRAVQTAQIIAKNLQIDPVKIIQDARFREKSFGKFEGLLRSEAIAQFPEYANDIYELVDNYPEKANIETIPDFENRIFEALEDIKIKYAGKKILIVAHGGTLRTLESKIKGRDYSEISKNPHKNLEFVRFNFPSNNSEWHQDEDVLDTWFSSGQWVYATLQAHNLKDKFFPTNVLVSAHDILENWDSRMMMFTYFHDKQIPFENLFLTGLVLGTDGQKMSKSKGNMIDMDKIVSEYGTDAVRMVYFYQNKAGGNYAITYDKLKNFKQFMNKIWNASRFVLTNAEGVESANFEPEKATNEFSIKLLEHIKQVKAKVTKNIDSYEFGYATETLYEEFWKTFCDVLIEESKPFVNTIKDKETGAVVSQPDAAVRQEVVLTMLYVLKEYLKMMHPFIPFITQYIWNEVPKTNKEHKVLMYSQW